MSAERILTASHKFTRDPEIDGSGLDFTPQEYPQVIAENVRLTGIWHENYQLFREIRKLRDEALVTPHLPHPDEITRPAQPKLYLI